MKKIHYANSNHKRAGMAKLLSDNMTSGQKYCEQEEHFTMIKESIEQGDIKVKMFMYLTREPQNMLSKN